MGKRVIGECHICGQIKKLSKEHIPPESIFNENTVWRYPILNPANLKNDILQPNRTGGSESKGGNKEYTLCVCCNEFTGGKYGREYSDIAKSFADFYIKNNMALGNGFDFEMHNCFGLRFFKQIISMFCSINKGLAAENGIKEFLLDENNNNFNKEKYKVFMYLNPTMISMLHPFQEIRKVIDFDKKMFQEYLKFSEIYSYPFGFCLIRRHDETEELILNEFGMDITDLSNCGYNDRVTINIPLVSKKPYIMEKIKNNTDVNK